MEYSHIKNLDKPISKFIFGAAPIGNMDEDVAFKLLDDMYSLGINTFDTAAVYGGNGEGRLIKWIAERGIHDDVNLLTKCAHHNAWRKRANPFDIMSDVTDALAKPGADYIDIYLMHRDDPDVPVAAIIDTLNRLHDSGKIKCFGTSNWHLERLEEANEYAYKYNLMPFSIHSPQFGLAEQVGDPWGGDSISIGGENGKTTREYLLKNNIPVFAYASLANGFMSGKVKSNDKEGALEILSKPAQKGYFYDCNFERLARAEQLAKELNISVPTLALAWLLNHQLNTFAITTTTKKSNMEQNIKAFDVKLTQEQVEWLDSGK